MALQFISLLLGGVLFFARIRLVSGFAALVLLTPLVAVPLASMWSLPAASVLALGFLFALLWRSPLRRERRADDASEFILFLILWALLRLLINRWPEFYNIGEHLRDFAILAEVIRHPLAPRDPWCDAFALNYYVYWYRLGAVVAQSFHLSVAETYHQLIAFAPALTFALLVRCFRLVGHWRLLAAIGGSVFLLFGSNLAGIAAVLSKSHWWGPSRAISIGITEFPAWSFLLGDLHPHYLSLVFPPFFLLFALEGGVENLSRGGRFVALGLYGLFVAGIIAAANTWDLVGVGFIGLGVMFFDWLRPRPELGTARLSRWVFVPPLFGVLGVLSTLHLQPVPLSLRLIGEGVPRVELSQFFSHWGVPLGLLLFGGLILRRELRSLPLPVGIVVGAIAVLLFQSFFYFDDLYSGEFERLNTIFKLSFVIWVPLSFGALLIAHETFARLPASVRSEPLIRLALIGGLLCSLLFFIHTAFLERPIAVAAPVLPRSEGLSLVERETKGGAEVVQAVRELRNPGPVVEWNAPSYSNASMICSLSTKGCYIGWANHLRIQYKDAEDEIRRREGVLSQLYSPDRECSTALALARKEGISAVIVTTREKRAFPRLGSFECFPGSIIREGASAFFTGEAGNREWRESSS